MSEWKRRAYRCQTGSGPQYRQNGRRNADFRQRQRQAEAPVEIARARNALPGSFEGVRAVNLSDVFGIRQKFRSCTSSDFYQEAGTLSLVVKEIFLNSP